jgi:hypothetical protein
MYIYDLVTISLLVSFYAFTLGDIQLLRHCLSQNANISNNRDHIESLLSTLLSIGTVDT